MAIAFVGAAVTAGAANPTGAQTWPLHASAVAGNVAIGLTYSRGSTKVFHTTAETAANLGVDLVVENGIDANYGHLLVVAKTLVAADITNGYFGTMLLGTLANGTTGWGSLTFSGVDTTNKIDAEGTIAGATGSTAPNCPAVTVGTTGSAVVAVWGSGQETTNNLDSDFSIPSGYTLTTLRWTTTLGSDAAMQAFYLLNATAGSNDPGTSTTIVSSYWYAHTISLEASSGQNEQGAVAVAAATTTLAAGTVAHRNQQGAVAVAAATTVTAAGSVLLAAPATVTLSMSGEDRYIEWDAVPGATGYVVERSVDGGAWTQVSP